MDPDRLDDVMDRSLRRARRRRRIARLTFTVAVVDVAIVAAIVAFQPLAMGRAAETPVWTAFFQPPLAFAGAVIGLAWMWRILRADPDPDPRAFRYHELDR